MAVRHLRLMADKAASPAGNRVDSVLPVKAAATIPRKAADSRADNPGNLRKAVAIARLRPSLARWTRITTASLMLTKSQMPVLHSKVSTKTATAN